MAQTTRNYHLEMEEILRNEDHPHILMHACCAPCASACMERLAKSAQLTLFFYNPNIMPQSEYLCRLQELNRLVKVLPLPQEIPVLSGEYEPDRFLEFAKNLMDEPERGERCRQCIRLRLEQTAIRVKITGADYFGTTLTVSPHKDADFINQCGEEIAAEYGVKWLPTDFKKRDGYKRSIELSEQYGLYRQNYCGCIYSRRDAANR